MSKIIKLLIFIFILSFLFSQDNFQLEGYVFDLPIVDANRQD